FTLLYVALMVTLRRALPAIYSANPGVQAIAATLLLATAAYHLADEVQTLSVFVLRSYRITVLPLAIYCALLWGVGLAGGYALAYRGLGPWPALHSPLAFWLMAAIALILAALLLATLLLVTLRRRR
ncbi:MAG: MATE family efflux transporter, partial [Burkholderiaceae bacterium]|nr:MATE family efflux transporter [Burkholderiaceae bacterium]